MFTTTNSYMSTGGLPDIRLPEFREYFSLFTFSLTANMRQSPEYLPICKSGTLWSVDQLISWDPNL